MARSCVDKNLSLGIGGYAADLADVQIGGRLQQIDRIELHVRRGVLRGE